MSFIEIVEKNKIIPVVKINDAEKAIRLSNALIDGGINICEITFRTSAAPFAIEQISKNCPDMFVGAGTVLNVKQAKEAIDAGAKFVVSPGISSEVCSYCISRGIPVLPGCVTASEITTALGLGLNLVKFFPSEAFGGIKTIKALSAPFPMVQFIPTGGISYENLDTYLNFKSVVACGASYLTPEKLIDEEKFDEITNLCKVSKEKIHNMQKA